MGTRRSSGYCFPSVPELYHSVHVIHEIDKGKEKGSRFQYAEVHFRLSVRWEGDTAKTQYPVRCSTYTSKSK